MVYDAQRNQAFWLHIQNYVTQSKIKEDEERDKITVRIPTRQKVTLRAIDYFHRLSLENIRAYPKGSHETSR